MSNSNFLLQIDLEDVKEFLQQENFAIKERGKWIYINSPFQNDNKYRCCFSFSEQAGTIVFTDFIARAKINDDTYRGSFWKFLALYKELSSISEAKVWFLTNIKKLKLAKVSNNKTPIKLAEKLELPERFERFDKSIHKKYYDYLISRKVEESQINKLKLFIDEKYKRIIFPVYESGQLINYTGRAIDDNPMRWQKSSIKNTYPIWNLENTEETIWIFEGIFDALRVPNGIALLGASLNEEQTKKICNKSFYKIVVVMDNDEAGRKAREQICYMLSENMQNVYIYDWSGIKEKDFSDIDKIDMSKIHPWNFTTQLKFKMNLII